LYSSLAILIVFSLSLTVIIQSVSAYSNYTSERTLSPIFVVSTRTQFPFDTVQLANSSISEFGAGCPPETAVYIHGYYIDEAEALEEFRRIQTSLSHNDYRIPLIGFSWNSKIIDYQVAKNISKDNGPLLAQFIIDFNKRCPDSHIRIIAHSLGAAVVESALVSLDTNPTLQVSINSNNNNNSEIIKSVHLLGAAINNELIADNTAFSTAIEHTVDRFYNLYDPEDDGLQFNKRYVERYDPLGLVGAPDENTAPNYNDTNVAYEIPPLSDADGDGNAEECFENISSARLWGDNHCGYIGFRQPFEGSLIDDGAMNIVVRNWVES
jgi:hypothetical protein